MSLPGTPNDRIGDIRTFNNLTQKELSDLTGISPSQLSRIESGEIKNISSDILIKLAKTLHVSTDFILGLTTIRTPKSYDISELGLSEGVVKNLLIIRSMGATHIINRLLEHKHFPTLTTQIKAYFYDENAMGVIGRNELFEMASTSLEDLRKGQPDKSADIREGIRFINAEKIGKHEIDIEKIKNTFVNILRDIKKEIDSGDTPVGDTAPLDMLRQMQEQLQGSINEDMTEEEAASVLTQQLGQMGIFNEDTAALFKNIAQSAFEELSEKTRGMTDELDKSDSDT